MTARERLALSADRALSHRQLDVGDGHEIYFEECGNPRRQAGAARARRPGRRLQPHHAPLPRSRALPHHPVRSARLRPLDAARLRSRPTPPGTSSPTWSGCATHLGIERWQVFGGSWGSTLALAYAETHPERVSEPDPARHLPAAPRRARLVLPGGLQLAVIPTRSPTSRKVIPPDERGDMIAAYHRRLTDPDRDVQLAAAQGLERVGGHDAVAACRTPSASSCSAPTPTPSPSRASSATTSSTAASSRSDDQLLADADAHPPHPRHHRPRPLRRRDAGQERLGPASAPGRRPSCASSPTPATP